jgi:hypothetical protein
MKPKVQGRVFSDGTAFMRVDDGVVVGIMLTEDAWDRLYPGTKTGDTIDFHGFHAPIWNRGCEQDEY